MEGIGATCSSASGKAEKRLTVPPNFSPLRQRKTVLADPELLSSASPVTLSNVAAAHLTGFDGEDNTMQPRRLDLGFFLLSFFF